MRNRICKKGMTGNHGRFVCLLLTCFLLLALTGCKDDAPAPEFPPTEETARTAVEELGWTLNLEETETPAENQIHYALEVDDQTKAWVSCAEVEGTRFLTENFIVMKVPDKPQFAWEDWEKAVTLAERLYGVTEGEFYQTLSEQDIPEPEIPAAGANTPTGMETLRWEAEFPVGYGRLSWAISAGTVEHTFPSPVIKDWRILLNVSLYESKEAYESIAAIS